MSKQVSCLDDHDPESIAVDEAVARIQGTIIPQTKHEQKSIYEVLGCVLAKDIISTINVPSARNSAMDGYALHSDDIPKTGTRALKVAGSSFAGKSFSGKLNAGECVRIMTGAVIPQPCNTVVIQEHVEHIDDQIIIDHEIEQGANIREAGEDLAINDLVLSQGKLLIPADIGVIASLGIGEISIICKIKVGFFSTGDELRSISEPLPDGCVYDSNRYTLYGMLQRLGVDIIDYGVVRDDPQALQDTIQQADDEVDLLISSGGVSVGDADYVKPILSQLGQINFWKVAIKPGRPLTFGQLKQCYFFGLPGNPVSVMVTFYQFVQPAIKKLMGMKNIDNHTFTVNCLSKLKKRAGRVEYQRGILKRDESGQLGVEKTGLQGSGVLHSMSHANCFIILPMEATNIAPGMMVEVQPFFGVV